MSTPGTEATAGGLAVPDDPRAADLLAVFAPCWAIGLLFHQSEFTRWARDPVELAATASAVVVVVRPRSLGAFLAFLAFEVANLWVKLPYTSNHFLFKGIASLTILCAVALEAVRAGRPLTPARVYRAFAPLVRVELLVLYFFVVFHKLNTDFLDPQVSCAGSHYRHLRGIMPFLPAHGFFEAANIWLTLGVESAIPLLLVVRRTRTLGIFVAIGFHYVVGINNFFDFSSMLYASYVLFAPEDAVEKLAHGWRASRFAAWWAHPKVAQVRSWLPPWLLVVLVVVSWSSGVGHSFAEPIDRFGHVWRVYGALWIAAFGLAVLAGAREHAAARRILRPSRKLLLVFPVLLFLNALSPYFGLKTQSSLAMFSNLRTEMGRSNHLIIPAGALEIWGYQRDVVTIVSSSNPFLKKAAQSRRPITYYELRSTISEAARRHVHDIEVTYVRKGKRIHLAAAERDPALRRRYPLWARKFFWFREIQRGARQRCDH